MSDRKYVVYKHTNKSNGKVYIGITYDVNYRWRGSGAAYKSNAHFWAAIQQVGWDGFTHEILHENLSHEDACGLEMVLIKEYNATDRRYGYNKSPGGAYPLVHYRGEKHHQYGKPLSDKTKKLLSLALSGENHYCYGKHLPAETRAKIGAANKKNRLTEAQKQHLRELNLGKKQSLETRQKRSHSLMGHIVTEETRQKISETRVRKPINKFSRDGKLIETYESVSIAAAENGLTTGQICKCCKGVLSTSGGFIWQYA